MTADQFIDYYCQRAQIAWECLHQNAASLPLPTGSNTAYLIQPQSGWLTELLKGLPTVLIALIAAGIAYRQYRVARNKLKLDLFDKRYAIFQQTWEILSEVVKGGTQENSYGLATPFNKFLPQAAFLFGKDIEKYLDDVSNNWIELCALEAERADVQGAEFTRNVSRASELKRWFFVEASKGAKQKFGRYLNFDGWR